MNYGQSESSEMESGVITIRGEMIQYGRSRKCPVCSNLRKHLNRLQNCVYFTCKMKLAESQIEEFGSWWRRVIDPNVKSVSLSTGAAWHFECWLLVSC